MGVIAKSKIKIKPKIKTKLGVKAEVVLLISLSDLLKLINLDYINLDKINLIMEFLKEFFFCNTIF